MPAGSALSESSRARGRSLGLQQTGILEAIRQIEDGLSFDVLRQFQEFSQLPIDAISEATWIQPQTLAGRNAQGAFSREESDRLVRLALIFERAVDLCDGNREAARGWMTTPNREFDHKTPLAMTKTEIGARAVEDLIGRLEHGVFS